MGCWGKLANFVLSKEISATEQGDVRGPKSRSRFSHRQRESERTSAVSTSKFGLRVSILRECSRKTLSHFFVCRLVDDCKCEQEKKKKRQFSASLKVVLEILNHSGLVIVTATLRLPRRSLSTVETSWKSADWYRLPLPKQDCARNNFMTFADISKRPFSYTSKQNSHKTKFLCSIRRFLHERTPSGVNSKVFATHYEKFWLCALTRAPGLCYHHILNY